MLEAYEGVAAYANGSPGFMKADFTLGPSLHRMPWKDAFF